MKAKISQLVEDEGAVSPVIGVILMVAITVILAAVIGTFVLGLGGQVSQTAPQASISVQSVDYDDANGQATIVFKHGGSDNINVDNLNIKVTDDDDDFSISFDSVANSAGYKFSTAETATVYLDEGTADETVDFSGASSNPVYTGSKIGSAVLETGDTLTFTWVDTPSGQIVADKSVTL